MDGLQLWFKGDFVTETKQEKLFQLVDISLDQEHFKQLLSNQNEKKKKKKKGLQVIPSLHISAGLLQILPSYRMYQHGSRGVVHDAQI